MHVNRLFFTIIVYIFLIGPFTNLAIRICFYLQKLKYQHIDFNIFALNYIIAVYCVTGCEKNALLERRYKCTISIKN